MNKTNSIRDNSLFGKAVRFFSGGKYEVLKNPLGILCQWMIVRVAPRSR